MSRRRQIIALTVLSVTIVSMLVQAAAHERGTYRVRKEDSTVMFTINKWVVFKEEGRFKDFEGTVRYDPARPAATEVDFKVYTSSIDSRDSDRDAVLKSNEFFAVRSYPVMTFRSVSAMLAGTDSLLITGDFTIRNTTKRISIPVRIHGVNRVGNPAQEIVGFETVFTINRLEFGVGQRMNMLGDEATIHLLIGAGRSVSATHR